MSPTPAPGSPRARRPLTRTLRAAGLAVGAPLLAACGPRDRPTPDDRPAIEDLDPPRGCFPRRQPDNRDRPPAATEPTTTPTV